MRTTASITTGLAIAAGLLLGCSRDAPPDPLEEKSPPPPILTKLPVTMVLTQRTTTAVPGSKGALQITIDDITRGQAMVSLAAQDGEPLLAPTSLKEGATAPFAVEGRSYYITMEILSNELIGDDSATLTLADEEPTAGDTAADSKDAANNAHPSSEAERIRYLIEHVRSLEGAVFIRNGDEHTASEAAEHLQRKWDYAGDAIQTAEQFIDELATKSSTTGEEYMLRLGDGMEVPSGKYLHQQLDIMATEN